MDSTRAAERAALTDRPTLRWQPERVHKLEELERTERWFDYRFDGWSAWRVMRNAVFRQATALPLSGQGSTNHGRALRALAMTLRLLVLLVSGRKGRVMVKTARSGLRQRIGDRYRDVYFDGVLKTLDGHFKLEEVNSPNFEVQARMALFPSTLDPVVFTFWGKVLGYLFPAPVDAFCKAVSTTLHERAQLVIDPAFLRMRVSTVYWQIRLLRVLIRRLRPPTVCVCDTGEYALRLACAREGIPFVELQHGVFDDTHPDAIPAWVAGDKVSLVLPDQLAAHGQFWVDALAGTRQGQGIAVAIGNELIDQARASNPARRDPSDRLSMVLTSQGLDSGSLAAWVTRMLESAPPSLDWNLQIKLHPSYDAHTRAFDGLNAHPRVRVVDGAASPNVFELLSQADLHLSISSACHFDAAALGVCSAVIPLAGHEPMLRYVDGRSIHLLHSPAAVWHLPLGACQSPEEAIRFAKPGFVHNFCALLPVSSLRST